VRRQTRTNLRKWLVSRLLLLAKEGGCERCGATRSLHFRHRDRGDKVVEISKLAGTDNVEELIIELGKCDVLCKSCHAQVESEFYAHGQVSRPSRETPRIERLPGRLSIEEGRCSAPVSISGAVVCVELPSGLDPAPDAELTREIFRANWLLAVA
jgi:hypothetical protein